MRTYRELFALSEFRVVFAVVSARYAGTTACGIALSSLVYARTGSPLLSAAAMFGSSLAQAVGAATLSSLSDRLAPRAALTSLGVGYAVLTAVLGAPIPVWALLSVVGLTGVLGAVNGGVQWGLVREVVPDQGYLLSRSALTVVTGLMQVLGFGVGGVLTGLYGACPVLFAAVVLFAASAAASRLGLRRYVARSEAGAAVRTSWRINRELFASRERRVLFTALWLPTGLIVGCEALFVPYSPHWAGLLLSAAAVGMLAGDVLVARVLDAKTRARVAGGLRLLLAAPYLLFAVAPPLIVTVIAVLGASGGYAATLVLQERLVAITPSAQSGHVLGLHSAGMMTLQGAGALVAGLLAVLTNPSTAIAVLAAASALITLGLARGLRSPA